MKHRNTNQRRGRAPLIKDIMRRRMVRVVGATAILVLIVGSFALWLNVRNSEIRRSDRVFSQVNSVLQENSKQLAKEQKNYRKLSLDNAKMVAYILQYHPEARKSTKELKKICRNMEIDEIHIFNEKGVIIQGTQPQYYGYSFDSGEQMAFFKPLLKDKTLELVQDVTPNTAAGKLEQYSALWSEDGSFIVEVGMHPQRVLEYMESNELPYVFHMVGAGGETELYAVDLKKNVIKATTESEEADLPLAKSGLEDEELITKSKNGFFANVNGTLRFCVAQKEDGYYLINCISAFTMMKNLTVSVLFLLLAVMGLFFFLTTVVMKEIDANVIHPIQFINHKLKSISDGQYDTRVEKQSSEEFTEMADYVNDMAASIQEHVSTVHYQSRHDLLTGVWNRNALQIRLGHLRNQEGSCGILYADLNGLKKINDEHGHDVGDKAIQALADSLTNSFGKACVYRAGGDEFVVLDEQMAKDELVKKFTEFRDTWNEDDMAVASGMVFCEDTRKIDQKMIDADAAMYAMKRDYYRNHAERGNRATDLESALASKEKQVDGSALNEIKKKRYEQGQPLWMKRLETMFSVFSAIAEDSYVYLCDLEHDMSIWSRNAVDTFGLPDTHMEHASELWELRIHPDDREVYHESIERIFSGEVNFHDMQYRAQERNGRYDMCTCRGMVINDENGVPQYFGGTIKNHTLENRVDPLSGLMNREGFFDALKALIRNHSEAVILMMGLSGFSEVNALYGYEFGNKVIRTIARHFASELGNLGDYFRLDGTQSILIGHNVPVELLEGKYEKLQSWLYNDLIVEGHRIPLRLNGSIMKLDQFDIDDNTVYVCLNSAFMQSKNKARGELVHFQDLSVGNPRDSLRKLNTIRRSLSTGFDGFEMFYQPIVDTQTEALEGAEALLRWHNDEFGFVPPDTFMDVLENDAQFYNLGLWILRKSMMDGVAMVQKYPDFVLHINLAYTQILNAGFVQDVLAQIEASGFPAENLCLEITERCRLADKKLLRNMIAALKAYGVRFALDDFGTGYSSAGLLSELELDVIKIDKSFVQNVEHDLTSLEALGVYVRLAGIYGAQTCVEGIETAEMRKKLMAYPIDTLQGYYYSKPIPLPNFYAMYEID